MEERVLFVLETSEGMSPFESWFRKLKDKRGRRSILVKLTRLQHLAFTNFKSVGRGVHELRIYQGPGYRVYFAFEGDQIVLLLLGGDKSSQTLDIKRAQELWSDYQNETETHRREFDL